MKHKIAVWGTIAGLLAASCAAAGCGSTSGTSSNGEVNLTVWVPFSGPDGPHMQKIADDFNRKYNGKIHVKLTIVPNNQYYNQINLAFAGQSTLPNLFIMHVSQIPNYASKHLLMPMDKVMQDLHINKAEYPAPSWQGDTYDGKIYAIPWDIHPLVLYYNKTLFKEAGITHPPTNRQEFIEDAKKLTNPAKGVWGYVVPTLWPQQFIFPTILYQNGGQLLDPTTKQIEYDQKAGIEALQFERDLIFKYHVSPANVQQDGEVTLFLQGKNAMQLNGPWMMDQWEKSNIDWGIAPVPQLGTVKQAVYADGHNWAIPVNRNNDTELKAVETFIQFAEGDAYEWALSGQAPANQKVRDSADFQKLYQQPIVAKEFSYAEFAPQIPNWGPISDPLYQEIDLALLGKVSPEQALKTAAAQSEKVLNGK